MHESEDIQQLPDLVFNLEKGYVLCRGMVRETGLSPSPQGEEFNTFFPIILDKDDVVVMLYLTLNLQLNQTRLKSPELDNYWTYLLRQGIWIDGKDFKS